jgi:hypothetical protein
LARLREMGVSFVNKEDLMQNSKRFSLNAYLTICSSLY